MTNEQAKREVDSLDFYLQNHTDDYGEESHTAMMMAIKALEQQTCEDAISRKATVERLCKVAEFMNEKRDGLGSPYIMAALFIQDNKEEFPSVQPETTVCEDAISRKKVDRIIMKWLSHPDYELKDHIYNMTKDIHKLPSVQPKREPEQRVGHWIWQTKDIYRCSECGEDIHVIEVMNMPQYKRCPMCEAKMEVNK